MAELFTLSAKVALDLGDTEKKIEDLEKRMKQLTEGLGGGAPGSGGGGHGGGHGGGAAGAFKTLTGAVKGFLALKAVQVVKDFAAASVGVASSLKEVQNVVDVTFGDQADTINDWAKDAKKNFGMTELQAKQYASTIGAMGKSMGVADGELVGFSENLSGLAGDMASFYNLDYDTAFQKIRSGISGETEPLKQLGVNMSEANLQAYAMEKGMGKAYKTMTQGQKAMLRYNYLMDTTKDAHGDFARTSDELANSGRVLESTWTELQANVGNALLPMMNAGQHLLTDFMEGINSLFEEPPKDELTKQVESFIGGLKDLKKSVNDSESAYLSSMKMADANKEKARGLLDTYDELSAKTEKTSADHGRMRSIVSQLTAIYPELASAVDATTGLFTAQRSEIDGTIQSMADYAKREASLKRLTEAYAQEADAEIAAGEAREKAKEAYNEFYSKDLAKQRMDGLMAEAQANDTVIGQAEWLMAHKAELGEAFAAMDLNPASGTFEYDTQRWIAALTDETAKAGKAADEASKRYLDMNSAAKESEQRYQDSVERRNQIVNGMSDTVEGQQAVNAATAEGVKETQAYKDKQAEYETAVGRVTSATEAYESAQKSLNKTMSEFYNKAMEKAKSAFGTFDKGSKVAGTSVKQLTKNLKGQEEYHEQYAENLEKAKQMAADGLISDDLLTKLNDGSVESAKILAGFAKASEKEIAAFNEQWISTQSAIQNTAQGIADIDIGSESAQQGLNVLTDAVTTAKGSMEEAQGAASTLKSELEQLEKDWIINIKMNMSGQAGSETVEALTPNAMNAHGLDYVPYDDYATRLHRGEMVLTRAEAEKMRSASSVTENSAVNVTGNQFVIRSQQDIEDLAVELATLSKRRHSGRGVRA